MPHRKAEPHLQTTAAKHTHKTATLLMFLYHRDAKQPIQ